MEDLIYLDNNATTRVDPKVLDAMMPFLRDQFANASSTHLFGVGASEAVKLARAQIAELIGADAHEIVFTSGATEAINLGIKGVAEKYNFKGNHIITIKTEHTAVLDTCKYLENKGFEVTYLDVRPDGLIDLDLLKGAFRSSTILVCTMLANNETGVIQPIKKIVQMSHEAGALVFTDATQAFGKIQFNVDDLGVDLICFSGHKLHAPKGTGGLYVRQRNYRVKLTALFHGGGHERGLRSGTLNVPGIVALGEACAIAKKDMQRNAESIGALRDYLETELLKIDGTSINGNVSSRLYNTSNMLFRGADSDAIIMGLSNPENAWPLIAVSNGSACTSASVEPSHVLTAMGLDEVAAFSSIRFSIGKFNTKREMDIVIDAVRHVVSGLRSMIS